MNRQLPPELWAMILDFKKKHYAGRLVDAVTPNLDYIYDRFFTGTRFGRRGYSIRQSCYFIKIVMRRVADIVNDQELRLIINLSLDTVNGWRKLFMHLNQYYPLRAKYIVSGTDDFWEAFAGEYPEVDKIVFHQYLEDTSSDAADTFGRDLSSDLHYSDSD